MASRRNRLALYTTAYPGVRPFLSDWHRSVTLQTDQDFDLWIGLDQLEPSDLTEAIGVAPRASWISGGRDDPPGKLRANALTRLATEYTGVILVDSDDVLAPDRVAAARAGLQTHEVVACALRLVDGSGRDLGAVFGPARPACAVALLPRYNVFGLSNTAFRGQTLAGCLPVPDDCVLVDWLLATRAWARGVELVFEPEPRMAYRQYGRNIARVIPPFSAEYVQQATELVLKHYALTLDRGWPLPDGIRQAVEAARAEVTAFRAAISTDPARLARYEGELNRTQPEYIWWWCVAHPGLEATWRN
jgi:hypothetical protein